MKHVDYIQATAEEISEAINWASDCLGMRGGQKASAGRAMAYVEAHYPGGWLRFVAECIDTAVYI